MKMMSMTRNTAAATQSTHVVTSLTILRLSAPRLARNATTPTAAGKTRHHSERRFTTPRGEIRRRGKTRCRGKTAAPSWLPSSRNVPAMAAALWESSVSKIIFLSWDTVHCRRCLPNSFSITADI